MFRTAKTSAVIALGCLLAAGLLTGCDDDDSEAADPSAVTAPATLAASPTAPASRTSTSTSTFSGTAKITVQGHQVNASCSGTDTAGRPVVILLPGMGDGLDKMAALQTTLSADGRVCSYDRLG